MQNVEIQFAKIFRIIEHANQLETKMARDFVFGVGARNCFRNRIAKRDWKDELKEEGHGIAPLPSRRNVRKHICKYEDNPDVSVGKTECRKDLRAMCAWNRIKKDPKIEDECVIKCNLLSKSRCKLRKDCKRKYNDSHEVCKNRYLPCKKLSKHYCKKREDCEYSSKRCRDA